MDTDEGEANTKRICSGTPPSKLNKKSYKETCKFTINSLLSKPDRPYKTPPHHLVNNGSLTSKRANTVFSFNDSPEKLVKLKSPHTLTAEVTKLYSPPHLEHTYQVSNVSTLRSDSSCKDGFVTKESKKVRQPIACPTTPTRPTTAQLLYQRQINRQELQESRKDRQQCRTDGTQCSRKEVDTTRLKQQSSPIKSLSASSSPIKSHSNSSSERSSPITSLPEQKSSPVKHNPGEVERSSPTKPSGRASPLDIPPKATQTSLNTFQAPSPVKMATPPLPKLSDIPIPPPQADEPEEKPDVSKLSYGKLSFFKKAISASMLEKAPSSPTNGLSAVVKTEPEPPNLSPKPMLVIEPPVKQTAVEPSVRQPEQRAVYKPPDQSLEALQASIYQTFIPPGKPKPTQKKRAKSFNEGPNSPAPRPKTPKDGHEIEPCKLSKASSEHGTVASTPCDASDTKTPITVQNTGHVTSDHQPQPKKRKISVGPESGEKRKKFSDEPRHKQELPTNEPSYSVVNNILLQQKSCSTPLSKPNLSSQPLYREFNSKDGKLILRKEGSKPPKKSSISNATDHGKFDAKTTLNNHIQMKCIESNAMLNISRDYADHRPPSPLTTVHKEEGGERPPLIPTHTPCKKIKEQHRRSSAEGDGNKRMKSQEQYKYSAELNTDEQLKAQAKQKDLINGVHIKPTKPSPERNKGQPGEIVRDSKKMVKTLNDPLKTVKTLNDPVKLVKSNHPIRTVKTLNDPLKGRINEPMQSVHELNKLHGYGKDLPTRLPTPKKASTNATPIKELNTTSNGVSTSSQPKGAHCINKTPSHKKVDKRPGDIPPKSSSKLTQSASSTHVMSPSSKPNPAMAPKPVHAPVHSDTSLPTKQAYQPNRSENITKQPSNQCQKPNIQPRVAKNDPKTPQKPPKQCVNPPVSKSQTQLKREKKPSGKGTTKAGNKVLPAPLPQKQQLVKADGKKETTAPTLMKTEPEVAQLVVKSEPVTIASPKPTLSQISSTLSSSNLLPPDNLLDPKTIGETSSSKPIETSSSKPIDFCGLAKPIVARCTAPAIANKHSETLCDPAKYVRVKRCDDGEATTVHLDMDEFNTLGLDEQNMVVDYFFEVTFGETDGLADNVMGVIHNGAEQMSNVLEHLAEFTPAMKVKHQVLGTKEIKTSTIKEYRDSVKSNFSRCVFHEGGLLQTSLVGTKNEESGGFFGDLIDQMDANPFLEASVPWGTLTNFAGREPGLSSDGPIFWVRPGEQFSRATQTARAHKGYRLLKSRETLIPDRTNPHADHSWEDGQTCATTGAGAFLQAVHYGEGYNPDNTLKDVILFDSHNFYLLVNELQLDLYEPPMTQCEIWIEDAKLNHLQNLNVKYAKIRLKSNDIYFIPRNVIHQFKTVRACASVAWHSRLKMYYN